MTTDTKNGTLLVLDGADGSGKATQAQLLVERLRADGHQVETMDFPQYTNNYFGGLLRECLDGKRGDFLELDPRIASTLYAADRFESSKQIRQWLDAGAIVVLDRYVSSNMLHQGGKIADEQELHDFLSWLDAIEHEVFQIPRPDLIVYLEVSYSFRQHMLFGDATRTHMDTVETDETYQTAAEANAKRLIATFNTWHSILCVTDGELCSRETIAERVYTTVAPQLP